MAVVTVGSPRRRRLLRLGIGAVLVVALAVTVGAGPFLRGLAAVSPQAIVAAVLLTAAATAAAAWRWRTVAGALGLRLRWTDAVAGSYRSQFLNAVLPGGIIGDVHRAYDNGRRAGDAPLAARAVATEKIAGQVVQLGLAAAVLLSLGLTSSLQGTAWIAGVGAAALALAIAVAALTRRGRRAIGREVNMARRILAEPRASAAIASSSILVVASLAATFVVACLAVGVQATPRDLIALALIALSAAALPVNVAGWGPREAAAASAFGIVGLGADVGVAVSTAFGVLILISVLPGAVVLVVERIGAQRSVERIREGARA